MANQLIEICHQIKTELIKDSPKITVTSICKLANVHRSTFYRYFNKGLDQAYLHIFTEEVRGILNKRYVSMDLNFRNLVIFLQNERLLFARLKEKIAIELQLEVLQRLMIQCLKKYHYPIIKNSQIYEMISRSNSSRIIQWMVIDFKDNHQEVIYDLVFALRILERTI